MADAPQHRDHRSRPARCGRAVIGLALGTSSLLANAAPVVLNFTGLGDQEAVASYYDGGLGGSGSGPGPSDGVTFESNAITAVSLAIGGSANIFNTPDGQNTAVFFLTGSGDVMNVPAGFSTGLSFFETGPTGGTVSVYSGLDGTGSLLATLSLPPTPPGATDGGVVSGVFSVWAPVGVTFSGSAESVNFSGSANAIGFTDITLGASAPVPEPGTWALMVTGLLGIVVAARKSVRQTAACPVNAALRDR